VGGIQPSRTALRLYQRLVGYDAADATCRRRKPIALGPA
jgi:hypothetical protein